MEHKQCLCDFSTIIDSLHDANNQIVVLRNIKAATEKDQLMLDAAITEICKHICRIRLALVVDEDSQILE